MLDYIKFSEYNPEDKKGSISVLLPLNDELIELGEKYEEVCEYAYMNGYNWEAIFSHLIDIEHEGEFEEISFDSEGDMFVAILLLTSEGKEKAKLFAEIMSDFIQDEKMALEYIKKYADDIEWD